MSHSHGWWSLPLLPAPFCKYAAAAEQRYRVLVGHDSIEHDGQTLTGPRALLSRWKLLDQVPADALGGLPSPLGVVHGSLRDSWLLLQTCSHECFEKTPSNDRLLPRLCATHSLVVLACRRP